MGDDTMPDKKELEELIEIIGVGEHVMEPINIQKIIFITEE